MLELETNSLFNSELLRQYDEDGQKNFLGYLLRTEKWNIQDSKIVFPNIRTENNIKEKILNYENDCKKMNLKIKKETLKTISIVGMIKFQDMLEDEKKKIETKEGLETEVR